MIYLKAYKAYMQQDYDLCMKLLQEMKQNDVRKLDLQAQVFFQKREYQKAYDLYQDLIKRGGEFVQERRENVQTLIACAQLDQPGVLKIEGELPDPQDIIRQVEVINLNDGSTHNIFAKPMKKPKKNKKRKQHEPVAGLDPERWIPRKDRKGAKSKKRRPLRFRPQGR